jgi:Cu+-exporting ATPase
MNRQTLQISGMSCAACQIHVQKALQAVPGVESANVNLMAHTAQIDSSVPVDSDLLIKAVRSSGYEAAFPASKSSAMSDMHDSMEMDMDGGHLGLRTVLALVAGAVAMMLSMPLMMDQPATSDPLLAAAARVLSPLMPAALMTLPAQPLRWILCVLALGAMLFAAPEIYSAAWRAARHRATNMNTLVALGTLAAFASSLVATIAPAAFARNGITADVYYEAVVLILAFLLTGRWLEARARSRATAALRGFARLQPSDARLLSLPANPTPQQYTTARETKLPLDAIAVGDILRVLPGDRIPLDATILHGRSSIDESMLTGEPVPVTRTTNERVYSGTLNLDGALIVQATAIGSASTLAQIEQLLNEAQSSRAPMQRLADRASAIFVPTVLALAAITFTAWAIAANTHGHHEGYARAFAIAIAVLIIACPCAMGLAVPAAITVSIGRAAQAGLLIKGGESLERLSSIDTIALDKTGTLTLGRPTIAGFVRVSAATLDEPTLLAYAAALERLTTHPLAKAVVDFSEQRHDLPAAPAVEGLRVLPGTGLTATIAGKTVSIGNASLLGAAAPLELNAPEHLSLATPLYIMLDGVPQAAFFATDDLRPSTAEAITQLRALHIRPLVLTGDTAAASHSIAKQAGISKATDIQAQLLPAQKLEAIRSLQSQGHRVAMVGDGINDAAALAQADVGFAMPSGTDLAREAGEILLLHPDLRLLSTTVRLARRTTHIMRQNLGWALVYNAIGLPIAAGVLYPHFHILLSPILASMAMALSSVSVLANSLRLRRLPPA